MTTSQAAPLKTTEIVHLENVTRHFSTSGTPAVQDVSLSIEAGEWIALMGPSGCGKSTLLNLVGGLDTPDNGRIVIAGQDITKLNDSGKTAFRRDTFGFIFQFFNLLPTLTVLENVMLPAQLTRHIKPRQAEALAKSLLDSFGLSHRLTAYPATLSGGELQRVAIARALMTDPPILIADEPTGNLDSQTGEIILETLSDLCHIHGKTLLMATHSLEAASRASRIVRMRDGKILADFDSPAQ